jgi:hypothetical protein
VLNPFRNIFGAKPIAKELQRELSVSEEKFFSYLDQLSGSFVILYRTENHIKITQDACATKSAFYFSTDADSGNNVTSISSHAGSIARLHGLEPNQEAKDIFNNALYKKDPSRYLPGLITPFKTLKPLIANNYLDLKTNKLVRFFPRGNIETNFHTQDISNQLATIFKSQARLLCANRDVSIAITAGKDSRVTLAAFENVKNATSFTFTNKKTNQFSADLQIGKQLAEVKGMQHQEFDLSQYASNDFQNLLKQRSPFPVWSNAAQLYVDEFKPTTVHIRSTVSEIGRCFYNRGRGSMEISAQRLAETFTQTEYSSEESLTKIFEEYIHATSFETKNIFNYDPLDLFYWEHRNSKWQNVLCHEAEAATDVFIPYNNREILKLLLSAPEEARRKSIIHLEMIKLMEPGFQSIPIDSAA